VDNPVQKAAFTVPNFQYSNKLMRFALSQGICAQKIFLTRTQVLDAVSA
jgi:hypothetical protein